MNKLSTLPVVNNAADIVTKLCVRTVIDNYQRMLNEFYGQQIEARNEVK